MKAKLCLLLTLATVASSCSFNNYRAINSEVEGDHLLTRSEAVQTVYDYSGMSTFVNITTFTDLGGKSYAEAVVWAQHENLLSWIDGNIFGGDTVITRVETAALVAGFYPVLYRHCLEQIEYCSQNGIAHFNNIRRAIDYSDVPNGSANYMLFVIGYSLFEPKVDSSGLLTIEPMSGITKTELVYALELAKTQTLDVLKILADPTFVDYRGVIVEQQETGIQILLGMCDAELTTITGFDIKGDWVYRFEGLSISCLNDFVLQEATAFRLELSALHPSNWKANGISIMDTREEVEKILGDPCEFTPKMSILIDENFPELDTSTYCYDARGCITYENDEARYFIEVAYDEDGSAATITVTTNRTIPVLNKDMAWPIVNPVKGITSIYASGRGNILIENDASDCIFLNIKHYGQGDFVILSSAGCVFSHSGEYSGRIFVRGVRNAVFEIRTDGDWEIIGMPYIDPMWKYPSAGDGDYAFPVQFMTGKYQVVHEGSGSFEAKLLPNPTTYTMMPFSGVIIVQTEGSYSEVFDFETLGFDAIGFILVVTTEGSWTFERVFEFDVVDEAEYKKT